jgi:carbon starvation protein CstA
MRVAWAVLRIIVAGAVVAAIVGQLALSISVAERSGRTVGLLVWNFFSFFTVDSNALTVVVLLMGAWFLLTRGGPDTRWFTVLRLVLVTYMTTTGIVYNLLLRNVDLPQGSTLPWSNEVLHVVAPLFVLLDWLLAPGRTPLPYWRSIRVVVVFPIVWAAYTLVRGPFTPNEVTGASYWYPYPFLDPHRSENGYLSVVFFVVLIAAIIGLVAAGAIWVSRRGSGDGRPRTHEADATGTADEVVRTG